MGNSGMLPEGSTGKEYSEDEKNIRKTKPIFKKFVTHISF